MKQTLVYVQHEVDTSIAWDIDCSSHNIKILREESCNWVNTRKLENILVQSIYLYIC